MIKFGTLKTKILEKLTEAYASGNKKEIKKLLSEVSKDKDFISLYLFYEEIENKYFDNKEDAKLYLEEINPIIEGKMILSSKFCKSLDKKLGDVSITENELYSYLDTLLEDDTLRNVDKKIIARKKLVEHLTTKKDSEDLSKSTFTENENLLHAVLTNNFNTLYDGSLNEDEKKELKSILSISDNELKENFKSLREEVEGKLNEMVNDDTPDELKNKVDKVLSEVKRMKISKYQYYKLQELKKGL